MLGKLSVYMPTLYRLGLNNVAVVALYRLAIRSGLIEKLLPKGRSYEGEFFTAEPVCSDRQSQPSLSDSVVKEAEDILQGKIKYFSHQSTEVGAPPDWFRNPLTGHTCKDPERHWSKIADFNQDVGDIKVCWELSRFDWALVLARAYRKTVDERFLVSLNSWVADWIKNNPLNAGPNWKCGQESSIRLLQVLLTGFLLGQDQNPSTTLIRFIAEHCGRIAPTIKYAIAQDNNHGTSEAAALYVGGAWLEKFAKQPRLRTKGRRFKKKGLKWLENRVQKLVAIDGSFSQYSINYHRLLVDTLNIVEFWRRQLRQKEFSANYYARCKAAVNWLYQLTDESGDGPNLGSNDGARLFVLSDTDYRDFRPTVQFGMCLFYDGKVYTSGPWDEPLKWLELTNERLPMVSVSQSACDFPDGGYVVIRGEDRTWGALRYPNFCFRPGHADAFHLDLWHRGDNLLRDSGSYSYNAEEPWQSYFSSTRAHNTVEFDGRDQMPRLSRFLRGGWLQMEQPGELSFKNGQASWSGSYRDYRGASHKRTITNEGSLWRVVDELGGIETTAVLRWRLAPGDWQVDGLKCVGEQLEIKVSGNVAISRFELQEGWESRFYLHKAQIPVLEIEINAAEAIITSDLYINP